MLYGMPILIFLFWCTQAQVGLLCTLVGFLVHRFATCVSVNASCVAFWELSIYRCRRGKTKLTMMNVDYHGCKRYNDDIRFNAVHLSLLGPKRWCACVHASRLEHDFIDSLFTPLEDIHTAVTRVTQKRPAKTTAPSANKRAKPLSGKGALLVTISFRNIRYQSTCNICVRSSNN